MNYFLIPGLNQSNIILKSFNKETSFDRALIIREEILRERNTTLAQLFGKKRHRALVDTRKILCYLIYKNVHNLSLNDIGYVVGKGHCTVLYHKNTIQDLIFTSPEYSRMVGSLAERLKLEW